MSDAPKIVQDRLRAAQPREAHPDADVLTAFAEQALSGAERDGVMRHLARCGDCRETVALSLPPLAGVTDKPHGAQEEAATRRIADRKSVWFAWPTLRWAALAASVVVVASVLLLNPGKQPPPTDATVSYPAENKVQVPPAAIVADSLPTARTRMADSSVGMRAKAGVAPQPSGSPAHRDELQQTRVPTQAASEPTSLADRKREDLAAKADNPSVETRKLARQEPAAPAPAAQGGMVTSEKIGSANETVEVSGAIATVQTEAAQIGTTVENEVHALPIEKAKPALKEEADQIQDLSTSKSQRAAYALSNLTPGVKKQGVPQSKDTIAQWSLAHGKLQRSMDAGTSWQVVLQLEHPLLAFGARGNDVWAGGQAGVLFHSIDSGASWAMIQPSTKAGALTADIVAIDLRSDAEIIVSSSSHETWSTSDGGRTWDKK